MKNRFAFTAAVGAFAGLTATPGFAQDPRPMPSCTHCEQAIVGQLAEANRRLGGIEAELGRLAARPSRRAAVVIDFPERLDTPRQFGFTPTFNRRRINETAAATSYCAGLGYQKGQALFWEAVPSGPGHTDRILRLVCFDD